MIQPTKQIYEVRPPKSHFYDRLFLDFSTVFCFLSIQGHHPLCFFWYVTFKIQKSCLYEYSTNPALSRF